MKCHGSLLTSVFSMFALACVACGPDDRVPSRGRDGGSGGGTDLGSGLVDAGARPELGAPPDLGPTPPACDERAEYVYVIDRSNTLARFDPATLTFTNVGVIPCASGNRPFSMSVDQSANAWVLFNDGNIRLVSTLDASCGAEAFPLAAPFERFGMGFSADGSSELLFISGGTFVDLLEMSSLNPAKLGRVNPTTRAATAIGDLAGWPELSGNAAGGLYAFYKPDTVFSRVVPGRIVELDRSTGAETRAFELTAMGGAFESSYAFAYWGGRFYVFIVATGATNSEVWRFNLPPEGDGSVTKVVDDAGRRIVGAGVSICAPITLI
jgi:hypothetical protein